ncbi:MAG TPA: metalloregulator ArsR/SmtB family transcription factor [Candidatus Paceibacterota bacterium]
MLSRATEGKAQRVALLSGVLSNPTRVLIILFLQECGGAYVQEIAIGLEMSQSAVSHQLSLLSHAEIVSSRRDGRDVWYTLTTKTSARKVIAALRALRR